MGKGTKSRLKATRVAAVEAGDVEFEMRPVDERPAMRLAEACAAAAAVSEQPYPGAVVGFVGVLRVERAGDPTMFVDAGRGAGFGTVRNARRQQGRQRPG